jgi:MFS family permease
MFQALPLWLLWFDLPAAGYSVAILLSGIANGLVNPSLHTISTVRVPPKLRANVLTTTMVGWAVVNPLGLFLAGPILDAFGTKPVMIGFAAMQTLTMAIVATASVRELGRRRQLDPLEAAA